ncbi:MAG TPA: hypothetical protein PLM70_01430 [Bacteroidales bacterium]|nr:hypothetical protein [Bacteroidales bacterium]
MKNFWILWLALALNTVGFAQDTLNPADYKIFYYPNGQKSSEGFLVNGKPNGYWKSYNEKGILVSEGNRKNFELDSIWVFYNPDGKRSSEITYKNGLKFGKKTQYNEEEYTVEMYNNDTLIQSLNTYYSDGKLKKTVPIVEGKKHGMEKEFDKNGLVISVANYYGGILTRREQINRTDNFGFKQGNWKFFWSNGNLKEEGTFYNNKKHGFFKSYDTLGNFISVEKWENDNVLLDAPETKKLEMKTAYHQNGKPSITATFYKGVPEGIRREYDTTGNVIKGYIFYKGWMKYEGITDLNGNRQGLWKEYYETGELRSIGKYKDSKMIGEWKFLYPNQEIEIIGSYVNGKKDGQWQWIYPNRQTLMEENWDEGERNGLFVEYDENGNVITKGNYTEGSEEGEWFYENRGAIEKGNYFDGTKNGTWKTWFPNGNLAFEIEYEQDLYNGKYTEYWENGRTKISGQYTTGIQVGIWIKFDEEGNPSLTTTYKDGKEIQWNQYQIKE